MSTQNTQTARGTARGEKLKTELIVLEQEDYCDTAVMVVNLARKFSFHQLVGLEDYGCGNSPAAIIFSNRRLTAKQVDEVIRQNVDLGCE
jgi:hypothetical protein